MRFKKIFRSQSNLVIGLAAFMALAMFAWYATSRLRHTSTYQAVFLDNGQIYFGIIEKKNSWEVILTDVYYLQLREPLQGEESKNKINANMTLIKLGEELHGPTDRMVINRGHITFIEDLQEMSKVVQAIRKNHEKTGK